MAHGNISDDGQLALDVDAALKRLRIASVSADDFLLRAAVDDLRRASGIQETATVAVKPTPMRPDMAAPTLLQGSPQT